MIYNTLFVSANNISIDFENSFKINSYKYISLDYITIIKEQGIREFEMYLKDIINEADINLIIIKLEKFDASISIDFLISLKKEFKFKLIFIFQDSQNSFEFIDRYYAQISDLIIIDDTPYIDNFYTMLQIPFLKIDHRKYFYLNNDLNILNFNISRIEPNTIFNSSLSNLSKTVHTNYYYNKYNSLRYFIYTQKYFKEYQILFINYKISICLLLLEKNYSTEKKIFIDDKFKNIEFLYIFYWSLYSFIYNKNYKSIFNLINLEGFKNIIKIYKLYKYLKKRNHSNELSPSAILNTLFYKKYKL